MALYDVSTTEKKAAPSLVAGGTLYADSPIGTILPYGGASAPSGWFLCDGTAVSRTTYAELFAVIGTAFGAGDGSTTFNLPDMRESVPKGAGLTGNSSVHYDTDGVALGEFIDDRTQSEFGIVVSGSGSYNINNSTAGGTYYRASSNRHGATTEVKSVGVNYIIKAKMVAVPADFMAKVDEAVEEALIPTVEDVSVSGKYNCTYVKSGKVVTVNLKIIDTSYAANSTIVSAGVLPKSAMIQLVELGGNDPTKTPFTNSIVLKTDGSISQIGHYPMNSKMEFFFGSFTYVAID